MKEYKSLSHTKWECKYHIVWIPKYRKKRIYGSIRNYLGEILHQLAREKECQIHEGHLCQDHVHILISVPPKHSISQVVGYLKGKSAIQIARRFSERKRNYRSHSFWARGYFVSSVGLDESVIRTYIRNQETEDKRIDQMNLFNDNRL